MKIGVSLPSFGKSATRKGIDSVLSTAEECNLDSLWTADHLIPPKEFSNYGMSLESLTTLAYVAGKTEKILLGTSVIVFPMREVVLFAKQAASLQIFSNGRLLLGLGAGWLAGEFTNVRANFEERGQYFDEGIQLFRWLLRGNAEFSGEHYNIQDGLFGPVPKKDIPIYIGGNSGVSIRRAAKLANGWFPIGISPEQVKKGKATLQKLAGKKMEVLLRINIAFSEEAGSLSRETKTSSGIVGTRLAGSREEVVEQIQDYRKAGVDHIVCALGDREPRVLEAKIREIAEVVQST